MIYDAIVVGGGPAGSTAAMFLGKAGKKVLLVDKAKFPRDKTCGDAQGTTSASVIKELGIYAEYEKLHGQKIYGITMSSPNGSQVHLDVIKDRNKPSSSYIHKRMVFDNFLFQSAKKIVETKIATVTDIIVEGGFAKGVVCTNEKGGREEFHAKIILGADGALSVVAKKFGLDKNPPQHLLTSIRAYYKNVEGMTDRIEAHLTKGLMPGYFWIFPLPNKEANVGLGMIVKNMQERGVNLKDALFREIKENPLFRERFKNAKLDGEIRGWNLPAASYHRKCYGNGFLLLGDAASLIDPLSGEGVGNAMVSGKIASQVAASAMEKNDFSEKFLKKYDELLWGVLGEEIKHDYKIQQIGMKAPWLIDVVIGKASKDAKFKERLEGMLPYVSGKEKMVSKDFLTEMGYAGEEA